MRILQKLIRNSIAVIFMINFILLSIQLVPLFRNYCESEILTRVEIYNGIYVPNLKFISFTSYKKNMNELNSLYQKSMNNTNLNTKNKLELSPNDTNLNREIISEYLVKLVKENEKKIQNF